jgi:hypothetical protein
VDYPPFDAAVSRFQAFLDSCGVPIEIHWVAFPDVAWAKGGLYVRPKPVGEATEAARAKYERAVPRRLGVKFGALGQTQRVSYCYVYRPSSRIEAEHHLMPDGLKLSVPDPLPEVTVVTDEVAWERLREKEGGLRHRRFLFG